MSSPNVHPAIRLIFLSLLCTLGMNLARPQAAASTPTLYSQGDPSNDEQYLLQLLNRARQDPVGEGQRLAAWLNLPAQAGLVAEYNVSASQIASAFAAIPATPPLAFNADLIAAARGHSQDLAPLDGNSPDGNDHDGTDGSTPYSRVAATGFPSTYDFGAENFMPGAQTDYETHAAFLIDWGVASLGHRINAMSINCSDGVNMVGIGVAIKPSSVDTANPLVTTEDFASPGLSVVGLTVTDADTPAMLTGVVYQDANGNGQYDPGEGVAGITVAMNGGAYYAVTSASGGYAFPLVNLADGSYADGNVTVTMTGLPNGATSTRTMTITRYSTVDGTTTFTPAGAAIETDGSYRGNIEWDGVTGSGATITLANGSTVVPAAFFNGAAALSDNYYYLTLTNGNVFGYYNVNAYPYIFHADMGFEYVFDANDGKSGVYLYDFMSGTFFYSSPSFPFPYLYDFSLNAVLYYYPDPSNSGHYNTEGVRYFYDYATGQIITK